jgi:hypothetical protein
MEVVPDDEIMLITKNGVIIRSPVNQVRNTGRNAQGVKLVNLDAKDEVCAVARVVSEKDEEAAAARRRRRRAAPPRRRAGRGGEHAGRPGARLRLPVPAHREAVRQPCAANATSRVLRYGRCTARERPVGRRSGAATFGGSRPAELVT